MIRAIRLIGDDLFHMAHILLIEDHASYRDMLRDSLEDRGHTVVEAADGEAGLTCYRAEKFDVVITDIIMPGKDGVETIIGLRQLDAGARIIAISGGGQMIPTMTCVQIARSLGVKQVLEKPFTSETLEACIVAELA